MVKPIYFLKPAWCGKTFAGLRPEQGLQPVTRATALRRWFVTLPEIALLGDAVIVNRTYALDAHRFRGVGDSRFRVLGDGGLGQRSHKSQSRDRERFSSFPS